jgi:two-component system cell cycle response regulator
MNHPAAPTAADDNGPSRSARARELSLIEARSLPELLGVMVEGLRVSHGVEAVSLVIEDPQHEIRHLLLGDGHEPHGFDGVLFTDSVVALAPQMRSLARPWLGPYVGPDHQLLFPGIGGLASVAILPLMRGERLAGTLNLGSADPARFARGRDGDFLAHLGAVAGLAFDNACNRARLVGAGLADYLTGWHNRRYLQSRLREEIAVARRRNSPLALLMIDLDRFKEVNDRFGHVGGDTAIREVAMRIDEQIRESDAAARFDGDEFALLLPGAGAAEAALVARRIMQAVSSSPIQIGPGTSLVITFSTGIAVFSPVAERVDAKALAERLLAEADAALYRAKAAGRNCIDIAR